MGSLGPPATPPEPTPGGVTAVRCPWCGSEDTERIAVAGSQLMSEQFMCRACLSPFERIRR